MQSQQQLKESLLQAMQREEEITVVQPPAIGQTERQNELLMFIKPEILGVEDPACLGNSIDLIWAKLAEFGASVAGIVLVGGKALESKQSMDQHYGAINVLSKTASAGLNAVDRRSIYDALAVSPCRLSAIWRTRVPGCPSFLHAGEPGHALVYSKGRKDSFRLLRPGIRGSQPKIHSRQRFPPRPVGPLHGTLPPNRSHARALGHWLGGPA